MLFNSFEFVLCFLPIVFIGYFAICNLGRAFLSIYWLIAASFFFYSIQQPSLLLLLGASICINYLLGCRLSRDAGKPVAAKALFLLGLVFNLSILFFFKYAMWLISAVLPEMSTTIELSPALPPAISFFTFQQIAFLSDVMKGDIERPTLKDYTLFIAFFPQLISGPIVRFSDVSAQFNNPDNRRIQSNNLYVGSQLFLKGLFKKVVLADTLAIWVNAGYSDISSLNFISAWVTSIGYTFQLYFDFSGYTDMALGAALLFNIRLPKNFNSPYTAHSIKDFWRRWHMTLGRFLREIIYIPLGGSRSGFGNTIRNIFITFVICGVWHGAGVTFLVWGALHGAGMALHAIWSGFGKSIPKPLSIAVTFLFVNACWVVFRAETLSDAVALWSLMVDFGSIDTAALFAGNAADFATATMSHLNALTDAARGEKELIVFLAVSSVLVFISQHTRRMYRLFQSPIMDVCAMTFLASSSLLHFQKIQEFIYFRF